MNILISESAHENISNIAEFTSNISTKYTNKIVKQIGNEILSGSINIKPYYKLKQGKTPCEYCKYKSICNFNTGVCPKEYNYIGNDTENILTKISE